MTSAQIDIFGGEQVIYRAGAYGGTPGLGPDGTKCGTCVHCCRLTNTGRKTWIKCGLQEPVWTNGPGTDIKAGMPACEHYVANTWKVVRHGPEWKICRVGTKADYCRDDDGKVLRYHKSFLAEDVCDSLNRAEVKRHD